MSAFKWSISGPIDTAWTPEEMAQIGRAAQAFIAALPNWNGRAAHLVRLDGLGVIGGVGEVNDPFMAKAREMMGIAEPETQPESFSVSRKGTVWPIPGVPWVRSTETEFAEFARCTKTLALSEQLLHCTFAEHHPGDCAFVGQVP